MPTISPRVDAQVDAADGRQRAAGRPVRRRKVADLAAASHHQRAPAAGVEDALQRPPDHVNARTTRTTQTPGGKMYHHAAAGHRAVLERACRASSPTRPRRRRRGRGRTAWSRPGSRSTRSAWCWRRPAASRWAARAGSSGASARRRAPWPAPCTAGPRWPASGPDQPGRARPRRDADDDDDRDQRQLAEHDCASAIASGRYGMTRNHSVSRLSAPPSQPGEVPGAMPIEGAQHHRDERSRPARRAARSGLPQMTRVSTERPRCRCRASSASDGGAA